MQQNEIEVGESNFINGVLAELLKNSQWIPKPKKLIKDFYFFSGHEFSGRVVAFGAGAEEHHSNIKIGDLVVAEQVLTCGKCRFCLKVA